MSFLPLVQRELAVASRKRGTAWARLLSAGLALALAFLVINGSRVNSKLGVELLRAVTVLLLIEALLSGARYTADCLSEEKREGTLGLLFLTHLSGFDVVAGKLAGRGLAVSFNMLGVIPIYGLSILFGGVSGTQIACLSAVLAASAFFSLSLGLLVSSRGWSEKNVLVGSLLATLAVCFLPYLARQAIQWSTHAPWADWMLFVSPVFAYLSASGGSIPRTLWSGVWLAGSGLLMLVLAGWSIPKSYNAGEDQSGAKTRKASTESGISRRHSLLQTNPIYWLVRRQTRPWQAMGFAAFAIGAGAVSRAAIEMGSRGRVLGWVFLSSYVVNWLFKIILAAESARRFSSDRRSGALELLLTTPLPAQLILEGQHLAIRRIFFVPMLGVTTMFLLWMLDLELLHEIFVLLPCSLLLLVHDSETICRLGMLHGLRSRRLSAAVAKTIGQVLAPPAAFFMLVIFISRGMGKHETWAFITFWTLGCLGYNTALMHYAKGKLRQLRSLAAGEKGHPAAMSEGLPTERKNRFIQAPA